MSKVIFLKPYLVEKIWGAQNLQQFYYDLGDKKIGEAWVISAIPNKSSLITSTPFRGITLSDFFQKHPEWFDHYESASYPLLAKILDCNDDLSVQVHPTKQYQSQFPTATEKNEAWFVLGAQKDSSIIYGHNAKNKDELINFVKNNAWDQLLCKVNAKPNDLFYVPSGTLHALGRGLVIYEIQQASDVTYRLFDYRRNREMNVQEALDNINVPFITPHFQSDGNTLVDSKEFSLARIQNRGAHHYRFPLARWIQATVIAGEGKLGWCKKIHKGDNFILKSNIKKFKLHGNVELLISYIKK